MEHMENSRAYFEAFIDGEGFADYVARKRQDKVYGNNPELQAISEVSCPINLTLTLTLTLIGVQSSNRNLSGLGTAVEYV